MSSPLTDVDTNTRHVSSKSVRGSKIPSLPTAQRGSTVGRRSPFSVTFTGSPQHDARSTPASSSMSPPIMSKLPRKSHVPTQLPTSKILLPGKPAGMQQLSVPSRARASVAKAAPTHLAPKKSSPPTSRNKPLPSPPIAQVIDPNSSPKAQRTLVDAESGSPSEEEWPILRPENLPPPRLLESPPGSHGIQQRSVSLGAVPQLVPNSFFEDRKTPASTVAQSSSLRNAAVVEDSVRDSELLQLGTRPPSPEDQYISGFHAISTDAELALDSPLANKTGSRSSMVIVPPRISSKRSSLPLSKRSEPNSPSLLPLLQVRHVKSGNTKWPILEQEQIGCQNDREVAMVVDEKVATDGLDAPTTAFHKSSITGLATISRSQDQQSRTNIARVKRLSWRTDAPGHGPRLTIYADADAVLLGREDPCPEAPKPEVLRKTTRRQGSMTSVTRVMSKQTRSKKDDKVLQDASDDSSSQQERKVKTPVKIDPIRSMQPPRKGSFAASPTTSTMIEPSSPNAVKCSADLPGTSKLTSSPPLLDQGLDNTQDQVDSQSLEGFLTQSQSSYGNTSKITACSENSSDGIVIAPKAEKVLGMRQVTPMSSNRRRLPSDWMSHSFSSTKSKKAASAEDRKSSKTQHDDSSNLTTSRSSPIFALRAIHSQDVVRQSKLRTSESTGSSLPQTSVGRASRMSSHRPYRRPTPSSSPSLPDRHSDTGRSVKSSSHSVEPNKLKIKRSIRGMFHKRNKKQNEANLTARNSRQSLSTGTRSSLAKRIRDSANLSKVHLPGMSESTPECKQHSTTSKYIGVEQVSAPFGSNEAANGEGTFSCLEATADTPPQQNQEKPRYDTVTVVNKILDRVTGMQSDSPDRLRGLEIAEAVLHSVECFKEAKLSAELARKHARDAELNVERAGMEISHLERLCKASFDVETLAAVKELIKHNVRPEQEGNKLLA
ncbi:hypothetical protein ACN47E_002216 [Coniothyrium glycines]